MTTISTIGAIKILANASSMSPSKSDLLNGSVDGRIIAPELKKPVVDIKFMNKISVKHIPRNILIETANRSPSFPAELRMKRNATIKMPIIRTMNPVNIELNAEPLFICEMMRSGFSLILDRLDGLASR